MTDQTPEVTGPVQGRCLRQRSRFYTRHIILDKSSFSLYNFSWPNPHQYVVISILNMYIVNMISLCRMLM
jgi:hypothetical protein